MRVNIGRLSQISIGVAVALGTTLAVAHAQETAGAQPVPPTAETPEPPRNLLALLDTLGDDSNEASIFVVDPVRWFIASSPLPRDHPHLSAIGAAAGLRVATAGGIRCLISPRMTVINTKPSPANIFAGMRPGEVFQQLLATLSTVQWQTACGDQGIGLGDLTKDQQLLFSAIYPDGIEVRKETVVAGERPGTWDGKDQTDERVPDSSAIRIRLNKEAIFEVCKPGEKLSHDYYDFPHPDYERKEGVIHYEVFGARPPAEGQNGQGEERNVFGVSLLLNVPNEPKPSAIDYSDPRLDMPIWLTHKPASSVSSVSESAIGAAMPDQFPAKLTDGILSSVPVSERAAFKAEFEEIHRQAATAAADQSVLPTVGDLLDRVGAACHLRLVADRRIRGLSVYVCGQSARSGDILLALARSVAGAFRKIDGEAGKVPLYLLTDDQDGIGSRVGRLGEWADAAARKKQALISGVMKRTATNDPLSHLEFASDDKYALPAALAKSVESGWRDGGYESYKTFDRSALPMDLQTGLQASVDQDSEGRGTPQTHEYSTKQVQVTETMCTYLIVPGVGPIRSRQLNAEAGQRLYFMQIAADPVKRAARRARKPEKATPAASAFPPAVQTRILVASAGDGNGAADIVRAAVSRGFTNVWLQVSLADSAAASRILTDGIAAANGKIAVGAAAGLLRKSGLSETPDLNILDETMDEFAARRIKEIDSDEDIGWYTQVFSRLGGWTLPDPTALAASAAAIAQTPGLHGFAFRNAAAPGYAGLREGMYDIQTNGEAGYTVAARLAFLLAEGVDPIDIPDEPLYLRQIRWDLGFFTGGDARRHRAASETVSDPRLSWWTYRERGNREFLAAFYTSLRAKISSLPLYIDDRHTAYADANPSWFGSWDSAGSLPQIPVNSMGSENDTIATARRTSKTVFVGWSWSRFDNAAPEAPARFARGVIADAKKFVAPKYDGIVMDLSDLSVADLLKDLAALPPASAGEH